jgi:hypothetical protein
VLLEVRVVPFVVNVFIDGDIFHEGLLPPAHDGEEISRLSEMIKYPIVTPKPEITFLLAKQ